MTSDRREECLQCGRHETATLFVGKFCSVSCGLIYRIRLRLGLRVRKGL